MSYATDSIELAVLEFPAASVNAPAPTESVAVPFAFEFGVNVTA
mgnify:FL=1